MKQAHVNLAPEGAPVIGLLTVCALCSALLHWAVPTLVLLALLAFSLHFFRDPARVVPRERDLAVSPADGKIIRIAEREDPFSGEPRICVSIFMNVFSVHVNRSPVAGTVRGIRYACGEFFNASWDKASRDNEHCAWSLRDDEGLDWSFVQIAGFVARRIVPRAEPGDRLARGERFGMIRFGSRVDLYLPRGYDAAVGIADAVYAGQSVVARKNQLAGQDDYPPRPQSEETDAEVKL